MAAPFRKDETVTIERRTGATDPDYNTPIDAWEVVASAVWANAQDVLPGRAESTKNGLEIATQQTRLRIGINHAITPAMRVTLHSKGDRLMQIISGPAMLDDRMHMEFMLEGYSS